MARMASRGMPTMIAMTLWVSGLDGQRAEARDHEHDFQPVKVDRGLDDGLLEEFEVSFPGADDLPDRDVGRIASAHARGDHPLADRELRVLRNEVQPELAVELWSKHGIGAGGLEAHVDRRGWVGEKLYARRRPKHLDDTPHESPVGDDGHATQDTVVGPT